MKRKNLLSIIAVGILGLGGLAACGGTTDDPTPTPGPSSTIKIGLHTNLGAGAGYSAIQQGYFAAEGLNVEPVMGSGPNLATQVMNGDIQVSFMGGGVAYNYWAEDPTIKMVALDNLTDDDRLFANPSGPGKDLTIESSLEEIGEALKGATLGLDLTQTPASFLTTIINGVNEIMDVGEQIWYTDPTGKKVPNNLTEYNSNCEIKVSQVDNASVANSATNYNFVIAYAPSATLLQETLKTMNLVCKTSTHFAEQYKPSTWAVNIDWLEKNEDTFKKFMRALVKGMNYRRDTPENTCNDIEEITAGSVAADSLSTDIAIWLGDDEQIELYESGKMEKYAQNILDADRAGANADLVAADASVKNNTDFSYIYEAAKELAGK